MERTATAYMGDCRNKCLKIMWRINLVRYLKNNRVPVKFHSGWKICVSGHYASAHMSAVDHAISQPSLDTSPFSAPIMAA
jgi:hypothetical protein